MDTGKTIKILRVKMGLTQRKLASLLGVSPTALYNWESGRKDVSAKIAMRIVKVSKEHGIEMTLDEFFMGNEE